MGIPMIRGRKFTRQDATEVAILNEAAARKFWLNDDAVGKRVNFGANLTQSPWVTIVGVVGNVRHLGLETEPRAEVYRPYGNNPLTGPMIAIHTSGNPAALASLVRSEIRSIESEMPLVLNTIDTVIELSVAQRRFSMMLLGIFAALAMLLAIVGIYGVMSYIVSQRTHEIGLRMALGAQKREVLRMVVGEGLALTLIGVVIGVPSAVLVTRAMAGLLFGVGNTDPLTYLAVSAIVVTVSLAAAYVPARRAARVDPLVALRYE
jgi:putative ABC transport system permease protein